MAGKSGKNASGKNSNGKNKARKDSPDVKPVNKKTENSRRNLLQAVAIGGGALSLKSLPDTWSRPSVASVILPAHASTSCNFRDCEEGTYYRFSETITEAFTQSVTITNNTGTASVENPDKYTSFSVTDGTMNGNTAGSFGGTLTETNKYCCDGSDQSFYLGFTISAGARAISRTADFSKYCGSLEVAAINITSLASYYTRTGTGTKYTNVYTASSKYASGSACYDKYASTLERGINLNRFLGENSGSDFPHIDPNEVWSGDKNAIAKVRKYIQSAKDKSETA